MGNLLSDFVDSVRSGWRRGWKAGTPGQPFFTGISMTARTIRNAQEREREETYKLFMEVKERFDASPYADPDAADDFIVELAIEVCDRAGRKPSLALARALYDTTEGLLTEEGSLFGFPEVDWSQPLPLETGVALRRYLRRKQRFPQQP